MSASSRVPMRPSKHLIHNTEGACSPGVASEGLSDVSVEFQVMVSSQVLVASGFLTPFFAFLSCWFFFF